VTRTEATSATKELAVEVVTVTVVEPYQVVAETVVYGPCQTLTVDAAMAVLWLRCGWVKPAQ
jgi:hypothetical protein